MRRLGQIELSLGQYEAALDHLRAAYEARPLELAANPAALGELRTRLASNRMTNPLFDTGRFNRHIEQAYLAMQQRVDAGLPPDHLVISGDPSPA